MYAGTGRRVIDEAEQQPAARPHRGSIFGANTGISDKAAAYGLNRLVPRLFFFGNSDIGLGFWYDFR